jgi:hypothetical protein
MPRRNSRVHAAVRTARLDLRCYRTGQQHGVEPAKMENQQMTIKRGFIVFVWAVLISLVLLYFAEYFDVRLVREAGGRVV